MIDRTKSTQDAHDSGTLRIRQNVLVASKDIPCPICHPHDHTFDHTSIAMVGLGEINMVLKDGVKTFAFQSPAHIFAHGRISGSVTDILVPKGILHSIKALTDDFEFWCIYSHRDADGKLCETNVGDEKAYY